MIGALNGLTPLLGCVLMVGVILIAALTLTGGRSDKSSSDDVAALRREVDQLQSDEDRAHSPICHSQGCRVLDP